MRQITSNLYTFTRLLVGRVYMIEDRDGLTLIDASIPLAAERIVQQIEWRRKKITDVKRIIITHAHPDHVGALPKLKALTGAQVIASSVERPYVEGTLPPVTADPRKLSPVQRLIARTVRPTKPTPVDLEVTDGEIIAEVFGGLQVLYTPGHAPGHISLWQPERRILFTGDVVSHAANRLTLPFPAFTPDMDENKRSLKRLSMLDAQLVCFGHGAPLMENSAAALRAFARRVGAV